MGKKRYVTKRLVSPTTGLMEVNKLLTDPETGVIRDPDEIEVVGHRVVHGGESFAATTVISQAVKEEIRRLFRWLRCTIRLITWELK